MTYGTTPRKRTLTTATVAGTILLAVIWFIYNKRPVYRVTQINPATISTNKYSTLRVGSRNMDTPGYIEFQVSPLTSSQIKKKYNSGGIPKEPFHEKDIQVCIYDYINDKYLSVDGPLVYYNPIDGRTVFAKETYSYEIERQYLTRNVNSLLNRVDGLDWRIPIPMNTSKRVPLYFGNPSSKTRIPDVVYPAEAGGTLRSTSPDGRHIFIPYITQNKKEEQKAWIINTENRDVIDIGQLNGAGGLHKTYPISDSDFWISNSLLIYETGLDSKKFPAPRIYHGDVYLVNLQDKTRRMVFNQEIAYSYMKCHDLPPAEFRVCLPRIINGNIWVSIMPASPKQEDFGRIDINLDTEESIHIQPGHYDIVIRELEISKNIIIYDVFNMKQSQSMFNFTTAGFAVLDRTTGNILTSFKREFMPGIFYPPKISGDKLIISSRFSIWRCDIDGTNPGPIAPIDASPSLWKAISNPLDAAILSKIRSLL